MKRKKWGIRSCGHCIMSVMLMPALVITSLEVVQSKNLSEVQAKEQVALQNPVKNDDGSVTWDCVYFGNYPQSDKTGETKDPIKWRILSVNGDDAFLVADALLDVKPYNEDKQEVTWERCTLRSWLNGYGSEDNVCETDYSTDNFIDNAFEQAEQDAIKVTNVDNQRIHGFVNFGGNDTEDKIFLLSYSEIKDSSYGFSSDNFTIDRARWRRNTAYVNGKSQMNIVNNTDSWWLRTAGYAGSETGTTKAVLVTLSGWVSDPGTEVNAATLTVCPALHLDLSVSDVWSYAGTVCSIDTVKKSEEDNSTEEDASTENPTGMEGATTESTAAESKTTESTATQGTEAGSSEAAGKDPVTTQTPVRQVGDRLKDANGIYKVTATGTNPTVSYLKPLKTSVTKIKIPASVKSDNVTYKVTAIEKNACSGCKKLKSVTIGNNVTTIGAKAFYNCGKLTKITIPSKVKKIGTQAFCNCKKLKNITIKTTKLTTKNVGKKAFKGIAAKAVIKVPKSKLAAYKNMLKEKGVETKTVIRK